MGGTIDGVFTEGSFPMFTPSLPPTALMSLYNVQCLPLAGTLTTRCAKVRIVILANLKDNLHISGNIRICSKERRHLQISLYFKLQFKIVIDMNIYIATHIPGANKNLST